MTDHPKKRIIVVDDDPFIGDMYVLKFTHENFDIQVIRDSREALKKIREDKPDVVLLDIVLPIMDGFAILQEIKKDPALAAIKVLLLTNLGEREDVQRGTQLGADGYIVKAHFSPSQVVEKVREVLNTYTP